jgi:hypothetical protein
VPTPTSFYHLNFSVEPGGAHKDAHFVRGTFDEIRHDLETELAEGIHLYLLCWYGANLELQVFQRGALVKQLDVHPYLTIEIAGYPTITFDKDKNVVGYDFKSGDEEGSDEGSLSAKLFGNELADQTRVTIAWDRMELPVLQTPIAMKGEHVTLDGKWREDIDAVDDDFDPQDLLDDGWLPVGYIDLEE